MHSDDLTGPGRRHLELHLPLTQVPLTMGPTRFCPCTHHLARPGPGAAKRTVLQRFGLGKLCELNRETRYDATTRLGEATVYDASIFHKGMANNATTSKPVVVVAFAASPQARTDRNYTGHLAGSFPGAVGAVDRFRRAWRGPVAGPRGGVRGGVGKKEERNEL